MGRPAKGFGLQTFATSLEEAVLKTGQSFEPWPLTSIVGRCEAWSGDPIDERGDKADVLPLGGLVCVGSLQ